MKTLYLIKNIQFFPATKTFTASYNNNGFNEMQWFTES